MPEKHSRKDKRKQILDAALHLACEAGWENVTFAGIAARSDLPLSEIYEEFEEKSQLLAEYERRLNKKVLENMGLAGEAESPRDRLFDIMMERFELMKEDRKAITSILRSFRFDPKQAVIGAPHIAASMNWMMEAAGISTNGLRGAAKLAGLTAIYLKVLCDWAKDDSSDLSSTMASLDRALGNAEKMVGKLGL